jgi:hypothetical protein
MRKRRITQIPQNVPPPDEGWLNLDAAAAVEVTSEEQGLSRRVGTGRRRNAGAGGPPFPALKPVQLIFDNPQRLSRISLAFEETETQRSQEFVLRWSPDSGRSFREIVRQQWNFSPPETEFQIALSDVTVPELTVVPDISRGSVRASLKSLRMS